jgi:peptidoglycan/xylan/chitin deacetylase (PgdA/CDA1 family)
MLPIYINENRTLPKIPESLQKFVVADWDVAENGNARYDLNQRAKGGNFTSDVSFDTNFPAQTRITRSTANNRVTITATVDNGTHTVLQNIAVHGVTPIAGRTYLIRCYIHSVNIGRVRVYLRNTKADGAGEFSTFTEFSAGTSGWMFGVLTVSSVHGTPDFRLTIDLRDAAANASFIGAGESVTISDFTFWDCTADFGLSNCPSAAEMDTILTAYEAQKTSYFAQTQTTIDAGVAANWSVIDCSVAQSINGVAVTPTGGADVTPIIYKAHTYTGNEFPLEVSYEFTDFGISGSLVVSFWNNTLTKSLQATKTTQVKGKNVYKYLASDFVTGNDMTFAETAYILVYVIPSAGQTASYTLNYVYGGVDAETAVVLSFDDGLVDGYTAVEPILNPYGYKGTFYTVPDWIGNPLVMSLAQMQDLYSKGHDIANHGYAHLDAAGESAADIQTDIDDWVTWGNTNGFTRGLYHFAYPNGTYNANSDTATKASGILTARTIVSGYNGYYSNRLYHFNYLVLNTTTLQNLKDAYDLAKSLNANIQYTFHGVKETASGSTDTSISIFTDFIAYLNEQSARVMTISQYYENLTSNYFEGSKSIVCNPDKQIFLANAKAPYATDHLKMYNFAYTSASGIVRSPVAHVRFDGTDDWLGLAKTNLIAENSSFSVSCWVAPLVNNQNLFSWYGFKTDFVTDMIFVFNYLNSTSRFSMSVYDSVTSASTTSTNTMNITANRFYLVTIVYDQNTKRVTNFVNTTQGTVSNALANGNTAINYFRSGRNQLGTTYSAHREAQTTIFNKALTKDDVRNLFNARATEFGYAKI